MQMDISSSQMKLFVKGEKKGPEYHLVRKGVWLFETISRNLQAAILSRLYNKIRLNMSYRRYTQYCMYACVGGNRPKSEKEYL